MGAEPGMVGRSWGSDRPGLDAHHVQALTLPHGWPECVAFRAGARLCAEGADEVPMMLHEGLPIAERLTAEELAAELELGNAVWRRWFGLGWARAAELDETG